MVKPFVTDCDLELIRECSLEAFCGMMDREVYYIRFDQSSTDAVPQNELADVFDSVDTPVYAPERRCPAVWDIKPREEKIKKYGVTVNKDVKYCMIHFNNQVLANPGSINDPQTTEPAITLHTNDRIRIAGLDTTIWPGGLFEILSVHSDRDMGGLQLNTEVVAYLVD